MKYSRRHGFSLIEMLVVIAIIGILAGLVFKMVSLANRDALEKQTIGTLQAVAHAIEEFRAEYGQYPPCSSVGYEYEDVDEQTDWLRNNWLPENADRRDITWFNYGLVAYLWPRSKDCIEHTTNVQWIPDTARDEAAKARWSPFLAEVGVHFYHVTNQADRVTGQQTPYANGRETILDGWLREIHYVSTPPYLTYQLWSAGPNGASGDADDINREGWDQ